jgi:hypothetical protein
MDETPIPSTEPESSPGEGSESPVVDEQSNSKEMGSESILVAEDLQQEPLIEEGKIQEEPQIAEESQPEVESAPAEGMYSPPNIFQNMRILRWTS